MNILFADDMEDNRILVARGLERGGHTVKTVTNGEQILKLLEMLPLPDVIVTDYNMPPGMDGLEVLRHIRANSRFKHLHVIVYTTNDYAEFKSEVERLGGVLVNKMVNELLSAVDTVAAAIAKEKR